MEIVCGFIRLYIDILYTSISILYLIIEYYVILSLTVYIHTHIYTHTCFDETSFIIEH